MNEDQNAAQSWIDTLCELSKEADIAVKVGDIIGAIVAVRLIASTCSIARRELENMVIGDPKVDREERELQEARKARERKL